MKYNKLNIKPEFSYKFKTHTISVEINIEFIIFEELSLFLQDWPVNNTRELKSKFTAKIVRQKHKSLKMTSILIVFAGFQNSNLLVFIVLFSCVMSHCTMEHFIICFLSCVNGNKLWQQTVTVSHLSLVQTRHL